MTKRVVVCQECENEATIYTVSKEDITFCPFCGEPILLEAAESDDDELESSLEDEDQWL